MLFLFKNHIQKEKTYIKELNIKIQTLNPQKVLERGYSITKTSKDNKVLRQSNMAKLNDNLDIILAKGQLKCKIVEIN